MIDDAALLEQIAALPEEIKESFKSNVRTLAAAYVPTHDVCGVLVTVRGGMLYVSTLSVELDDALAMLSDAAECVEQMLIGSKDRTLN